VVRVWPLLLGLGATNAIGSSLNPGTICPYLGASANQMNVLFGSLDELTIYDRALTAAEIAQLYGAAGG
jgi:hypothetical protein